MKYGTGSIRPGTGLLPKRLRGIDGPPGQIAFRIDEFHGDGQEGRAVGIQQVGPLAGQGHALEHAHRLLRMDLGLKTSVHAFPLDQPSRLDESVPLVLEHGFPDPPPLALPVIRVRVTAGAARQLRGPDEPLGHEELVGELHAFDDPVKPVPLPVLTGYSSRAPKPRAGIRDAGETRPGPGSSPSASRAGSRPRSSPCRS